MRTKEQLKKIKQKRKLALIFLLLVAIITFGAWQFSKKSQAVSQPKIISYKVDQLSEECNQDSSLLLTGAVVPKKIYKIVADKERGKISEVHVKIGDHVEQGQRLFTYSNPDGDFEIQEAELALSQLVQEQEQKNTNLANKQNELYEKQNKLAIATNKVAQADEDLKGELTTEKETIEESISQLNSEILTIQTEIGTTGIEIEKAQHKINSVKQKYENKDYTAESKGVVKKIDESMIGQSNEAGSDKSFMELVDYTEYFVEGKIDEFQKERLAAGKSVEIIDRRDEGLKWTGKLVDISDLSDDSESDDEEDPNMTKYPFKVQFDGAENYPAIGRHVFIKLLPENGEALQIPAEYLLGEEEVFVWKVEGNKIKKTKVGIEWSENKQIGKVTEGLEKTDKIVYPLEGLVDGMEVGQIVDPN